MLQTGRTRLILSLYVVTVVFTLRTRARVRAHVVYCVFINKETTVALRVTELTGCNDKALLNHGGRTRNNVQTGEYSGNTE